VLPEDINIIQDEMSSLTMMMWYLRQSEDGQFNPPHLFHWIALSYPVNTSSHQVLWMKMDPFLSFMASNLMSPIATAKYNKQMEVET
jgi:hypothetical protein